MAVDILIKLLAVLGLTHACTACLIQRRRITSDPFHPRLAYRALIALTLLYPILASPSVEDFNDNTKLIILCSAIAFLASLDIADFFSTSRENLRTRYTPEQTDDAIATIFLMTFFAGWIWRLYALKTGLLHGTFLATQLETTAYGNLVGQLNNLSLIGFFGWLIFQKSRRPSKTLYFLLLAEVAWAFISGSKIAIFYVLFPTMIVAFQRGWLKLTFKALFTSALLGAVALQISFSLVTAYRLGVQLMVASGSELTISAIAEGAAATLPALIENTLNSASEPAKEGVSERLNWALYFGQLLERPDLTHDAWMGTSLSPIVTWWIPRAVWPSKPTVSIGAWYGEHVLGWDYDTRSEGAITIWGDGYLNFGLAGALLFPIAWIAASYFLYEKLQQKGPWGMLVLSLIYIRLLLGLEQNIAAPLVAFQLQLMMIGGLWAGTHTARRILSWNTTLKKPA